jgi:thymidine kinase
MAVLLREGIYKGEVEVYGGCMFVGKSRQLQFRTDQAAWVDGIYKPDRVLIVKPDEDTRNQGCDSRYLGGKSLEAKEFSAKDPRSIYDLITDDIKFLAIEEAHFCQIERPRGLQPLVKVVQELSSKGLNIGVAGCDMDWRRNPLEVMAQLMGIAAFVSKLSTACTYDDCTARARYTQKFKKGGNQIPADYDSPLFEPGDAEMYAPRCRVHHYLEIPGDKKVGTNGSKARVLGNML